MITYTELLPKQTEAVEKLRHVKVGALYMEMGTGKTRTALELIKLRLDAGKVDGVIWLCPCSAKGDILLNIKSHCDLVELGILDVVGIETLSSSVRENVRLLERVKKERIYLIVDESLLIKNHTALRSKHIERIADGCVYKLILNGTPISKWEADLYQQWRILDKRILGYNSFYSFAANHIQYDEKHPEKIRRTLNVDYLAEKIEPYTFQCRKEDCFVLPPKLPVKSFGFALTPEQDENYDACIERLMPDDMAEAPSEAIYALFNACQSIVSGFAVRIEADGSTERYPMFPEPEDDPRIRLLLERATAIPAKEKALIFCHYTEVLNRRWPGSAVMFYGEIPQKKRQGQIEAFRGPARFLVVNKSCGAYGINLQFCHRIIYYSHDWDWATRAQSEDRVHRFGQTEPVTIEELYAWQTIDVRVLDCLSKKEGLVNSFKRELDQQAGSGRAKLLTDYVRGRKSAETLS